MHLLKITHLLEFLIKEAEKHGLTEIKISVARAKTIIKDINEDQNI